MTLAFYILALPIALGYSLFVGISGQLNPVSLPSHRTDRATWLLGVWVGLTVSLILFVAAKAVYGTSAQPINSILRPTLFQLAIVITPAVVVYISYRYRIATAAGRQNYPQTDHLPDFTAEHHSDQLEITKNAHTVNSPQLNIAQAPGDHTTTKVLDINCNDVTSDSRAEPGARHTLAANPASQRNDDKLSAMLKTETSLREETEKHLRITRKALAVLEAETRDTPLGKSAAQIDIEEKLAESLATAATLEADVMQEKTKRLEHQKRVLELRRKVIRAKQEIRRSAAARARALSTANKSIAFARQSVQIRTRLESELVQATEAIDNRQNTITKLVRALDKEKRKSQVEILSAAKQIILQERQVLARRSLEGAARSVENNLASRLVKKVAKARPLTQDTNYGKQS